MNDTPLEVLVIEDNPGDARLIQEHLSQMKITGALGSAFRLVLADRLTTGLARLAAGVVDVVLLDLSLPDSQGLDTFTKTRVQAPDVPIVVLTGLDDEALALQAMQSGAQDYLVKGQIDGHRLSRAVRYAVERHRLGAELRTLALFDPLTGLYNRRGFDALAEQQMRMADRIQHDLLLFFVDIDNLKYINDTWGHTAGDRTLEKAASVLRHTFRASDIVARLGGDEFAALAIDTLKNTAHILMTRLQANLEAHNASGDRLFELSLSLGLTRYDPVHPCSLSDLLRQADGLMYDHKRSKRKPSLDGDTRVPVSNSDGHFAS